MSLPAMASLVVRQSVGDRVSDVKSTLSSWDKCMSKNYCKWPVIVVIVVVGLIVLSLLFCLFRCLCCGAECACCCFRCCASCCPSPSRKSKSHQRVPSNPDYHRAAPYSNPDPYHVAPAPLYGRDRPEYAQVARFESARKNDDALPAMPSWDDARSYKVEDNTPQRQQDVEMKRLDQHGGAPAATPGGSTPMRTPISHVSPPHSDYGFPANTTVGTTKNNPYQHHADDDISYSDSGRYYGGQETGVRHGASPVHAYGDSTHHDAAGFGYRAGASPPVPPLQWQAQQPTGGRGDGYESYRPYGAGQDTGYTGGGRSANGTWRDV